MDDAAVIAFLQQARAAAAAAATRDSLHEIRSLQSALAATEARLAAANARLAIADQYWIRTRPDMFQSSVSQLVAMNGYASDIYLAGSLCRDTRRNVDLWRYLINVQRGERRRTVLMYAAACGNKYRLLQALQLGAAVDTHDRGGKAALYWACRKGNEFAVKALIKAGASVHGGGAQTTQTPLLAATMRGCDSTIRTLLSAGAVPSVSVFENINDFRTLDALLTSSKLTGDAAIAAFGSFKVLGVHDFMEDKGAAIWVSLMSRKMLQADPVTAGLQRLADLLNGAPAKLAPIVSDAGCLQVVATAMERHATSRAVSIAGCGVWLALAKIPFKAAGTGAILDANGEASIVASLKSHLGDNAGLSACSVLAFLLTFRQPRGAAGAYTARQEAEHVRPACQAIIAAGGVAALVGAIAAQPLNRALTDSASFALAALMDSLPAEEGARALCRAGGPFALITALQAATSLPTIEKGIRLLTTAVAASNRADGLDFVVDAGGIAAVHRCLRLLDGDDELSIAPSCTIVGFLDTILQRSDDSLLPLIEQQFPGVWQTTVLPHLRRQLNGDWCLSREAYQLAIAASSLLETLAMTNGTPAATSAFRATIVSSGGLNILRVLLEKNGDSPVVAARCMRALLQLLGDSAARDSAGSKAARQGMTRKAFAPAGWEAVLRSLKRHSNIPGVAVAGCDLVGRFVARLTAQRVAPAAAVAVEGAAVGGEAAAIVAPAAANAAAPVAVVVLVPAAAAAAAAPVPATAVLFPGGPTTADFVRAVVEVMAAHHSTAVVGALGRRALRRLVLHGGPAVAAEVRALGGRLRRVRKQGAEDAGESGDDSGSDSV